MSKASRVRDQGIEVSFRVDMETLEQLDSLSGQQVVATTVWDDSVTQALADVETVDSAVDMDLYLSDGIFFELYGVLCYADLESEPLPDAAAVESALNYLIKLGIQLQETASDTEEDLVLVLADAGGPAMYLNVGAWSLEEWEELPDGA